MKQEICECDKCGADCSYYETRVVMQFPFDKVKCLCMNCAIAVFDVFKNHKTDVQARADMAERPASNAAAMREALERMLAISAEMRGEYNIAPRILIDGWETMIETTAKNALSAPPRNCDRFATVKDAAMEYAKVVAGETTPVSDFAFSTWLLSMAVEGDLR